MVSSMREIIAGSVFIFVNRWCSALHLLHQKHAVWLYHLFWSCRTWCIWCQQFGKKSQRKSKNVPFSLYGSQRGLGFHLESSEFLACTDSNKYGYDILSVYMFFNISSFLLNRKVTFCQGKYMYMPSDILSQKRKKTISLHYFCTIKNNSMETRVYIDSIRLGIAPWQGVISSCILGLDIPDRVCILKLKLRFIQCSSFKVVIHC